MVSTEIFIGKLTFRIVDFNQLKHQNHYIIRTVDSMHYCYISGRFLERVFHKNSRFIQAIPDGNLIPNGARFFVKDIYGEKRGLRTFYERDYYYELVSKKQFAQEAMEKRALQIILRNVIGDNHFTYA